MSTHVPARTVELRSTLTPAGTVEIELAEVPLAPPDEGEVLVRVEAAPVNPSDLISLLAGGDPAQARTSGAKTSILLPAEVAQKARGRQGVPLAVGLEGAGTVIAAGSGAQHLMGSRVAALALTGGMFAQHRMLSVNECVPLPADVSVRQAAGMFCNPLTALAIVETARLEGHGALVHTAAASNLGQMLVRICREDGVPLVNLVRRQEQVDLLRKIGAEHIVNSTAPDFQEQLRSAIAATGARIAFDAIGGGTMPAQLLQAFEDVARSRLTGYSPYGSPEVKQVYIYGHLDPSPTVLAHEDYGLLWDVRHWYMPATMARVGPGRAGQLQQRVVDNITTTFASHFSHEISLRDALEPDVMRSYARMASGQKYLINPTL